MQPYGMPEPIVKDASKIPATTLPDTYLYDIPTNAGEEITLVGGLATSVPVLGLSKESEKIMLYIILTVSVLEKVIMA